MKIFRPLCAFTLLSTCALSPLVTGAILAAPSAPKQVDDPLVDTAANGKGRINYGAGVVKATGYGALPQREKFTNTQAKLMAMGAARADALRTLAMTVSSIQVTATTKVKNYVLQNDTVETRLSALLQSPRVVSESLQPDGTAVVVVQLPMYGADSVASAVFPEVFSKSTGAGESSSSESAAEEAASVSPETWKGPSEPAVRLEPRVVKPAAIPANFREPSLTPLSDDGPFTSVIVDCRGLNIDAIMSPKLMDTSGREVYGTLRVTPEYAIETGIVGYPRSMAEALRGARAGAHPLIVRALRANDKFRFNPCLSREDGDRILACNDRDHFLESTRVIFLVDPLK